MGLCLIACEHCSIQILVSEMYQSINFSNLKENHRVLLGYVFRSLISLIWMWFQYFATISMCAWGFHIQDQKELSVTNFFESPSILILNIFQFKSFKHIFILYSYILFPIK